MTNRMLIESRTQGLNADKFLYSPEKVSEKTSECVCVCGFQ